MLGLGLGLGSLLVKQESEVPAAQGGLISLGPSAAAAAAAGLALAPGVPGPASQHQALYEAATQDPQGPAPFPAQLPSGVAPVSADLSGAVMQARPAPQQLLTSSFLDAPTQPLEPAVLARLQAQVAAAGAGAAVHGGMHAAQQLQKRGASQAGQGAQSAAGTDLDLDELGL